MKLFVCYGAWTPAPRPGGGRYRQAYHALRAENPAPGRPAAQAAA